MIGVALLLAFAASLKLERGKSSPQRPDAAQVREPRRG
jgi:hypothetical protein